MRCELPVKSCHVVGPRGVPFRRQVRLALCFGRPPSPTRCSRLRVGSADARQDAREMIKGKRRVLHEPQRDIAEEKLRVREGAAFDQAMLLDEPIGKFGIARRENPPGHRLSFAPPGGGPDQVARLGEQDLHRRIGHVLLAPGPQLLEDETRVRAQLRRNPRDQRVGVGGLCRQSDPRLRQRPPIRGQQRQHALRRCSLAIPQQPIDPLGVVFRTQHGRMAGEKTLLVQRPEIGADPGGPQYFGAARGVAGVEHDVRLANLARGADRRIALEPFAGHRIGFGGRRFLRVPAQRLLPRPVRVLFDKIGDVGKPAWRAGPGVIHPAQHFERQRVGDGAGFGVGAAEIARLRRGEGRAHGWQVGRGERLRAGGELRGQENRNSERQPAQHREQVGRSFVGSKMRQILITFFQAEEQACPRIIHGYRLPLEPGEARRG